MWQKAPGGGRSEPWKQLKDGSTTKEKPQSGPDLLGSGVNSNWKSLKNALKLDGHLPHETIHPSHIQADLEGDIDKKPVLIWKDHVGRKRRTYTERFHRERSLALRDEVGAHSATLEGAHDLLKMDLAEHAGDPAYDNHAAAVVHLSTGHRLADILSLKTEHAAVLYDMDHDIEKSHLTDLPHPHRVGLIMPHRAGHVYPTSFVDEHVSQHLASAFSKSSGQPLFGTATEAGVKSVLGKLGVSADERTVRHHAIHRQAADLLSKLPEFDVSEEGGLDRFQDNINQVSNELASRFGHLTAPDGMSFVPPSLVTSYMEHAQGHKLWPTIFKSENAKCTSTRMVENSSTEASLSTSESPTNESTSTQGTKVRKSRTRFLSHEHSPTIRGRPWGEMADAVELHLAKSDLFAFRGTPAGNDQAPSYNKAPSDDVITVSPGLKMRIDHLGQLYTIAVTACSDEVVKFIILANDAVDEEGPIRQVSLEEWDELIEEFIEKRGWEAYAELSDRARHLVGLDESFMANRGTYGSMVKEDKEEPLDKPGIFGEPVEAKKSLSKQGEDVSHLWRKHVGTQAQPTPEERKKDKAIGKLVRLLKKVRKGDEKAKTEFVGTLSSLANMGLTGFNPSEVGVYKAEGRPGPTGDPEGTTSKHADGSIWEKRTDGWHEVGADGKGDKKQAQDDETHKRSIAHQQGLQTLQRLRDRLELTTSTEERAAIGKQIAALRNRMAGMLRDESVGNDNPPPQQRERQVEKAVSAALTDFEKSMTSCLREMAAESSAMSPGDFAAEVMLRGNAMAKAQLRYLYEQGTDTAVSKIERWLR